MNHNWYKFLVEEVLPITNSDTFIDKQEPKKPVPQKSQTTTEALKQYIIKYIQSTGVQNITPEFAFAVAQRESSFNPKAKHGAHVGLFGIGAEAAKELGYLKEYNKNPLNLATNVTIGLKYLQYQIDMLGKNNFETKYPNLKLETYTLAYIAYNLGRQNMIRMVDHFVTKNPPNPGLITAIISQSPKFKGNTDADTVMNYFNDVNSVFGNL